MSIDTTKNMMLKFLEDNYPVSRIKSNSRFKRAIVLDNGKFFILGKGLQSLELQHNLMNILDKVFSLDEKTNRDVLKKFLKLK